MNLEELKEFQSKAQKCWEEEIEKAPIPGTTIRGEFQYAYYDHLREAFELGINILADFPDTIAREEVDRMREYFANKLHEVRRRSF